MSRHETGQVTKARVLDNEDLKMSRMARIAHLYYKDDRSQQEISEMTGLTRPAISRILSQAVERGVVTFHVEYPWRSRGLEEELTRAFGLKDAVVIVTEDEEDTQEDYERVQELLGVAAAEYVSRRISPTVKIGLSWGLAIHNMIDNLENFDYPRAEVFQIIGATGPDEFRYNGPDLARGLSETLNAKYYPLHAPLVVETEAVRAALLRDANIQETLEKARHSDFILTGIGTPRFTIERLLRGGYLGEQEAAEIRKQAVGEVCASYFAPDGSFLDLGINRRVIAFRPEELSSADNVVAVAGGHRKKDTIAGALKGRFLDVLLTNSTVALYVLEHL